MLSTNPRSKLSTHSCVLLAFLLFFVGVKQEVAISEIIANRVHQHFQKAFSDNADLMSSFTDEYRVPRELDDCYCGDETGIDTYNALHIKAFYHIMANSKIQYLSQLIMRRITFELDKKPQEIEIPRDPEKYFLTFVNVQATPFAVEYESSMCGGETPPETSDSTDNKTYCIIKASLDSEAPHGYDYDPSNIKKLICAFKMIPSTTLFDSKTTGNQKTSNVQQSPKVGSTSTTKKQSSTQNTSSVSNQEQLQDPCVPLASDVFSQTKKDYENFKIELETKMKERTDLTSNYSTTNSKFNSDLNKIGIEITATAAKVSSATGSLKSLKGILKTHPEKIKNLEAEIEKLETELLPANKPDFDKIKLLEEKNKAKAIYAQLSTTLKSAKENLATARKDLAGYEERIKKEPEQVAQFEKKQEEQIEEEAKLKKDKAQLGKDHDTQLKKVTSEITDLTANKARAARLRMFRSSRALLRSKPCAVDLFQRVEYVLSNANRLQSVKPEEPVNFENMTRNNLLHLLLNNIPYFQISKNSFIKAEIINNAASINNKEANFDPNNDESIRTALKSLTIKQFVQAYFQFVFKAMKILQERISEALEKEAQKAIDEEKKREEAFKKRLAELQNDPQAKQLPIYKRPKRLYPNLATVTYQNTKPDGKKGGVKDLMYDWRIIENFEIFLKGISQIIFDMDEDKQTMYYRIFGNQPFAIQIDFYYNVRREHDINEDEGETDPNKVLKSSMEEKMKSLEPLSFVILFLARDHPEGAKARGLSLTTYFYQQNILKLRSPGSFGYFNFGNHLLKSQQSFLFPFTDANYRPTTWITNIPVAQTCPVSTSLMNSLKLSTPAEGFGATTVATFSNPSTENQVACKNFGIAFNRSLLVALQSITGPNPTLETRTEQILCLKPRLKLQSRNLIPGLPVILPPLPPSPPTQQDFTCEEFRKYVNKFVSELSSTPSANFSILLYKFLRIDTFDQDSKLFIKNFFTKEAIEAVFRNFQLKCLTDEQHDYFEPPQVNDGYSWGYIYIRRLVYVIRFRVIIEGINESEQPTNDDFDKIWTFCFDGDFTLTESSYAYMDCFRYFLWDNTNEEEEEIIETRIRTFKYERVLLYYFKVLFWLYHSEKFAITPQLIYEKTFAKPKIGSYEFKNLTPLTYPEVEFPKKVNAGAFFLFMHADAVGITFRADVYNAHPFYVRLLITSPITRDEIDIKRYPEFMWNAFLKFIVKGSKIEAISSTKTNPKAQRLNHFAKFFTDQRDAYLKDHFYSKLDAVFDGIKTKYNPPDSSGKKSENLISSNGPYFCGNENGFTELTSFSVALTMVKFFLHANEFDDKPFHQLKDEKIKPFLEPNAKDFVDFASTERGKSSSLTWKAPNRNLFCSYLMPNSYLNEFKQFDNCAFGEQQNTYVKLYKDLETNHPLIVRAFNYDYELIPSIHLIFRTFFGETEYILAYVPRFEMALTIDEIVSSVKTQLVLSNGLYKYDDDAVGEEKLFSINEIKTYIEDSLKEFGLYEKVLIEKSAEDIKKVNNDQSKDAKTAEEQPPKIMLQYNYVLQDKVSGAPEMPAVILVKRLLDNEQAFRFQVKPPTSLIIAGDDKNKALYDYADFPKKAITGYNFFQKHNEGDEGNVKHYIRNTLFRLAKGRDMTCEEAGVKCKTKGV